MNWRLAAAPPWLEVQPSEGTLAPQGRQALEIRVEPREFAALSAGLSAGEQVWTTLEFRDDADRVALLQTLVIPADAGDVGLSARLEAEVDERVVRVGHRATIFATVTHRDSPLEGTSIAVDIDGPEGGLTLVGEPARTASDGLAIIELMPAAVGSYSLALSLPALPLVPAESLAIEVIPDDACGLNNGGCGNRQFMACIIDVAGMKSCADIDECVVGAAGTNGCGEASRWECTNEVGAPPTCVDIDECATDNGGCGDPLVFDCVNVAGGPPTCVERDPCDTDNGGCGDPRQVGCTASNGVVTCVDIDACAIAADGSNGCGDPGYWTCVDNVMAAPTCTDVDECVVGPNAQDGCGEVGRWTCQNNPGAPPTCTDVDECAVNNGGCPAGQRCINVAGGAPICVDHDECSVNNGGCGDPQYVACSDTPAAPPTCADIDECALQPDGTNGCGNPAYTSCTNNVAQPPTCTDIDECAPDSQGDNACGVAARWSCTNNVGSPPTCIDVDECATNNGGCNATWTLCANEIGAAPQCLDIDECQTANGGCGDPTYKTCTNNAFAPPTCTDIDECAPDGNGVNFCGYAAWWDCIDMDGAPPICTDLDECAVQPDGTNACGDAAWWSCTNHVGLPPDCVDIDECLLGTSGCNPQYEACQNQVGAAPLCVDYDECSVDNGGCGDPSYATCTNVVGGAAQCTDIDECADVAGFDGCGVSGYSICTDNLGAPPTCEDIDECLVVGGGNGCGFPAVDWVCENNPFSPPNCTQCPPGTTNVDLDPATGCEYSCTPAAETCNQQDDDCDGEIDEGFDLRSSNANCGACGNACGAVANGMSTCFEGMCVINACDTGFVDHNADPTDGCETPFSSNVLYVSSSRGRAGGAGTFADPYLTINTATFNAPAGATIVVEAGAYTSGFTVSRDDLMVVGEGPGNTVIAIPANNGKAIDIVGDNSSVSAMSISGASTAVNFAYVSGPRLSNLEISSVIGGPMGGNCPGTPISAYAIRGDDASDVRISGVRASTIVAGTSSMGVCANPSSASAAGIFLTDIANCRIQGVGVQGVFGAEGGDSPDAQPGGYGGDALGIWMARTHNCEVRNSRILNIESGEGGSPGSPTQVGRRAGTAFGVRIDNGTTNYVHDLVIDGLLGGPGGPGAEDIPGNGGASYGFYAGSTSDLQLERILIRNVTGGPSGTTPLAGGGVLYARPGAAFGARVYASSAATLRNVGVFRVDAGPPPQEDDSSAHCFYLDDSSVDLEYFTCREVGMQTSTDAYGVRVRGPVNDVSLSHGIISEVDGICVHSDVGPATTTVERSLFDCVTETYNVTRDSFSFSASPEFVSLPPGNLHLQASSPAIDAGDPTRDYSSELSPNGCAVDLGVYGGTDQSTPNPAANDCP